MKKQASWLLVAAFLSGMAGCGKKIPDDIIQPDAMESLLYDYHLASTMSSSVSYTENYKKDAYFKYVFQKHHVTEEEFDRLLKERLGDRSILVIVTSWQRFIKTCKSVLKMKRNI